MRERESEREVKTKEWRMNIQLHFYSFIRKFTSNTGTHMHIDNFIKFLLLSGRLFPDKESQIK